MFPRDGIHPRDLNAWLVAARHGNGGAPGTHRRNKIAKNVALIAGVDYLILISASSGCSSGNNQRPEHPEHL